MAEKRLNGYRHQSCSKTLQIICNKFDAKFHRKTNQCKCSNDINLAKIHSEDIADGD